MVWLIWILLPIAVIWWLARLFSRRNTSFTKHLSPLLDACAADGVITPDQKLRILERAGRAPAGVQLRGTTWIAIFSGLFVTAGVSLLIAHNWDLIAPIIRVISFVFLLAVAGEIAIRLEQKQVSWSIAVSLLWFFSPILGIGLYAQTFQLSGDPVRPFLVWAILTAPMAWLSQRRLLPFIHLSLLVGVLFFGNFMSGNELSLVRNHHVVPWLGSLLLLGAILLESFKLLTPSFRRHILGVIVLWIFLLLLSPTIFEVKNEGWLFAAAASASGLWLGIHLMLRSPFSDRMPPYIALVACTYVMSFLWHTGSMFNSNASPYGVVLTCLMGAAGLGMILTSKDRFSPDDRWHWFFQALFIAPIVLAFMLPHVGVEVTKAIAILANLLLFLGALGTMWHGSRLGSNQRINLGVATLMLVLITRFIDVLGDFVKSGVGFIATGLFLGLLAYALGKTRQHLIDRSDRGMP